jgi:hypothetical protein
MHIPVIKKECSLEKLFYGKVVIEVKSRGFLSVQKCQDVRI